MKHLRPLFGFFLVGCLALPGGLAAEARYYSGAGCDTRGSFDDNTSITFYGDSRGDLVDTPVYGESPLGWLTYLSLGADKDWNVQNLAIGGQTVAGLYNEILGCTRDAATYANYVTAKRYAVEIGGNDYVYNGIVSIFIPWHVGAGTAHVNQNQLYFLKLLKLSLSKRGVAPEHLGSNILFMNTFSVISRGPISGTPLRQCFGGGFNDCDKPWFVSGNETMPLSEEDELRQGAAVFLASGLGGLLIQDALNLGGHFLSTGDLLQAGFDSLGSRVGLGRPSTGNPFLDAYKAWMEWSTEEGSIMTLPSILVMLGQPGESNNVAVTGVQQYDPYPLFLSWKDCAVGACWVANGAFFRDLLHVNWKGYAAWGAQIGEWFASNGWDTPYAPPAAQDTVTTEQDLDNNGIPDHLEAVAPIDPLLLLLGCFLIGFCG